MVEYVLWASVPVKTYAIWGKATTLSLIDVITDYEGQRLSEQIMQWLIIIAAVVGFLAGYITSSYRLMLEIYVGGVILAFLLAVPDWPYFNGHKLSWLVELPPSEEEVASSSALAVSKSKQGKRPLKGKR